MCFYTPSTVALLWLLAGMFSSSWITVFAPAGNILNEEAILSRGLPTSTSDSVWSQFLCLHYPPALNTKTDKTTKEGKKGNSTSVKTRKRRNGMQMKPCENPHWQAFVSTWNDIAVALHVPHACKWHPHGNQKTSEFTFGGENREFWDLFQSRKSHRIGDFNEKLGHLCRIEHFQRETYFAF